MACEPAPPAASPLEWLTDFQRQHGRPLRVLHIGNIANNAYNNAKIQRSHGIAADVLSHDYYHIMACPEWEDADFDGNIADDMFPDWWAVGVRGFRRPRWFAQGPLDACVRYLLAAHQGGRGALWRWRALEGERWLLCRRSFASRLLHLLIRLIAGRRVSYVLVSANAALSGAIARRLSGTAAWPVAGRARISRWARRLARDGRAADLAADVQRHQAVLARRGPELLAMAAALDPPVPLIQADLEEPFRWWWHPYVERLYSRYDVIQGYATYTAMPFIARQRYVAYEHGTIRSIPFQDTHEGRLCAVTYRCADAVFVTNSDNLEAAEKLGLEPARTVCLPHAFDSDKLERFAAAHASKVGPRREPLFFSPTRHHWVDGDPGWAKGNDRVLHALRRLADEGSPVRLRLVAWGVDLERSRALVTALGLDARVEWVPPMGKRALWLQYLTAACVIDQFVVAAIGGVTFEAMMLGRPVITAIDRAQTTAFFGTPPPVLACQTVDEIAAAMRLIAADPGDTAGRGRANRDWMRRHHSAQRIVDLQVDTYRRVLETTSGVARKARRCVPAG